MEEQEKSTVERLELLEEQLKVTKRQVLTGSVRVRIEVDEVEHLVSQELEGERVEVTRVPVDRLLEAGTVLPSMRTEGRITIIPIVEEILVIEKRLRIKEELHITRHDSVEMAEIPVVVRKHRAIVERLDSQGNPTPITEE